MSYTAYIKHPCPSEISLSLWLPCPIPLQLPCEQHLSLTLCREYVNLRFGVVMSIFSIPRKESPVTPYSAHYRTCKHWQVTSRLWVDNLFDVPLPRAMEYLLYKLMFRTRWHVGYTWWCCCDDYGWYPWKGFQQRRTLVILSLRSKRQMKRIPWNRNEQNPTSSFRICRGLTKVTAYSIIIAGSE